MCSQPPMHPGTMVCPCPGGLSSLREPHLHSVFWQRLRELPSRAGSSMISNNRPLWTDVVEFLKPEELLAVPCH